MLGFRGRASCAFGPGLTVLEAPRELADPDGNRLRFVPTGESGVTQIGVVIAVPDLSRTMAYYRDVLGFELIIDHPQGAFAFMRAPGSTNHHDIAFFTIGEGAAPSTAGRVLIASVT